jgi:hypothetical protein
MSITSYDGSVWFMALSRPRIGYGRHAASQMRGLEIDVPVRA